MQPFTTLTSKVMPLELSNVDTDQIIPKQFLKRIERSGYGEFLFYDWRQQPDFALNQPKYAGAEILIAGKNFGCGSSREHAAWALNQYGFRSILAPSFADIFHSNAGKNGILLIILPEEQIEQLMHNATPGNYSLTISLVDQTVSDSTSFKATFTIDPFLRDCLLNGLDDIGLTLRHIDAITAYEQRHDQENWMAARS